MILKPLRMALCYCLDSNRMTFHPAREGTAAAPDTLCMFTPDDNKLQYHAFVKTFLYRIHRYNDRAHRRQHVLRERTGLVRRYLVLGRHRLGHETRRRQQ